MHGFDATQYDVACGHVSVDRKMIVAPSSIMIFMMSFTVSFVVTVIIVGLAAQPMELGTTQERFTF